ncbi:MAG: SEC-C metal-binding domain-containing protein [Fimbriimonadaceae bacterium]
MSYTQVSEYPNTSRQPEGGPGKRTRHTRVGRNSLCPCGSSKKYKACCGPRSRFR